MTGAQARRRAVIVDGPPHVRLATGSLPLNDGDVDNYRDSDLDAAPHDASVDSDNDAPIQEGPRFPDRDDGFTLNLGRGVAPAEKRTLVALVRRYMSAARALDGASVCSLLTPEAAASLGSEVSHAGDSCQASAKALLARFHQQLAASVEIVDVRIVGKAAEVVVGSRALSASVVLLQRNGAAWKVGQLLATHLP